MDGRYVNDIVNRVVKLIPQVYIFYKSQQPQRKLFYMYFQIEEELVIEKKDTNFIFVIFIHSKCIFEYVRTVETKIANFSRF